jgi:pilin isopeptide linkage protein
VANKIWLNADGTTFTGTTPPLTFLLNGATTAATGSLPVTNIPMLPGVPVLVLDGNYTITEPSITGFNLISIFSTTMTPNLGTRSANAPVTSNSDYSATFTNQAIPVSTTLTLYGEKIGNDIPSTTTLVPAETFLFTVTDQATGQIVATGTNEAATPPFYSATAYMAIDFTPIEYTQFDLGQHTLIVKEVGTNDPTWIVDNLTEWEVMVNVSLSGNNVVANATYMGEILFHNYNNARGYFEPAPINFNKTAAGGSMVQNQFTFAILDANGNVVSTGTNDNAGNTSTISFTPITYSTAGTYTYTVIETNPNINGWRLMNTAPFTITVDVAVNPSDPTGQFIVIPTYPAGGINFINVYESTGFLSLSAQKTASDAALRAGQFQFAVVDNSTTPPSTIATGTNDANGNISFSSIAYHSYTPNDMGFHQYSIIETSTSANGWTTSSVTYPLLVSVADNGNGTMTVTPFNISGSNFIFTNIYGSTGSVTLTAQKRANGNTLSAGQFAFAVQNELGGTIATGVNDAAGNITFTPISYTLSDVGIHSYTILETSTDNNGWTPSSVVYNVSVQVTDNGDGTLTATPSYPGGSSANVIFTNTYMSSGSIVLTATKSVSGSTLVAAAGAFTFAVIDDSGAVVSTGTNDANGNIFFSAIPYTTADVATAPHNYTIVEKDTGSANWQTDGTVYNVSVSVRDNGTGSLITDQTPAGTDIVFNNAFVPPPSGTLVISKAFTGLSAGLNVFNPNLISPITFLVVGNDSTGNEIYRLTVPFNRANFSWNLSTGTFDCVLPGLPIGTYTVTESGGHIPGFELSISTPSPSQSLATTGAIFSITNNYTLSPVTPPADTPALTVNKVFHGLTAAQRPADFQIGITGPGGFNQTLNLNQAISGSGGTFTNLAAGTYTINEVNSNVPGYNMRVSINNNPVTLPYAIQISDTSGHLTVSIDNFYTPVPPPSDNIFISKTFTGLPVGFNVFDQNRISPISFLVVGNNSANTEIYRQIVPFNSTNFTWNAGTRTFDYHLRDLPFGTYNVYESGGHVPGYELNLTLPPPGATVTPTGDIVFNIINRYSLSQVTPADHPALTVNKVFHGLRPAERPADFQIVVTGPDGFNQSINLSQALSGSGGSFINLATGTYTISEVNENPSGFVKTSVFINNQPVSLPYTVDITGGHVTVTIDNYYAPAPPSPPTGINSNIIIPALIFALGTVCITGAEIYRRRSRKNTRT